MLISMLLSIKGTIPLLLLSIMPMVCLAQTVESRADQMMGAASTSFSTIFPGPIIGVSPDSITDTLIVGDTTTWEVTIFNTGDTDLVWNLVFEGVGLGTVTFTKPNSADWTLPVNQDRITAEVWITRKSSQGIFNYFSESGYNAAISPEGTEWSFGKTADLSPGDYQVWNAAVDANPMSMVDEDMSLHLISDNIYFDLVFHSWTGGGGGAGFSYTRIDARQQWLTVPMNSGVVTPGDSDKVTLNFDAAGLEVINYSAALHILSNDTVTPQFTIPVGLLVTDVTGIIPGDELPKEFALKQNYPNPFNPVTTISYELSQSGDVSLVIYNLIGQEIAILIREVQQAGNYTIRWDASNVASGIYFYRIQAGDFVRTRKMVLLK